MQCIGRADIPEPCHDAASATVESITAQTTLDKCPSAPGSRCSSPSTDSDRQQITKCHSASGLLDAVTAKTSSFVNSSSIESSNNKGQKQSQDGSCVNCYADQPTNRDRSGSIVRKRNLSVNEDNKKHPKVEIIKRKVADEKLVKEDFECSLCYRWVSDKCICQIM